MVIFKYLRISFVIVLVYFLFDCQVGYGSQEWTNLIYKEGESIHTINSKSAGYDNLQEARDIAIHYEYFAFKISNNEWDAFYKRFPEYWFDMQNRKKAAVFNDYKSTYTAYAFRWNMVNYKKKWDKDTLSRLAANELLSGDDIYKIIYSKGAPSRILCDNDFEILIWKNNTAILLNNGVYDKTMDCKGCIKTVATDDNGQTIDYELGQRNEAFVMFADEIFTELGLSRPKF